MPDGDITALLALVAEGDKQAEGRLIEQVYPNLRAIARHYLRFERPDHTLQPTALVNEAYVKLMGGADTPWKNRVHFLAAAAMAVRAILIDHGRRRAAAKRGGGKGSVPLDEHLAIRDEQWPELMDLNCALDRLQEVRPRLAKVVVLRFFGDMTDEEIAEALHVSSRTVKRDWKMARAWLHAELSGNSEPHRP
jgi:RNA polymerase sigma factor (TIGR02999 family)